MTYILECGPAERILHGKPIGDCTAFRLEPIVKKNFEASLHVTTVCLSVSL